MSDTVVVLLGGLVLGIFIIIGPLLDPDWAIPEPEDMDRDSNY